MTVRGSIPASLLSGASRAASVHLGEGASGMRSVLPGRSVDMIYLDPPFFTQKVWIGKAGSFSDKWSWDAAAEARWQAVCASDPVRAEFIALLASDRQAYVAYLLAMDELLRAARSRLKPSGTLWLHCDDTASHELWHLCAMAFGPHRFWGTVISKRSSGAMHAAKCWPRVHDSIHVFPRSGAAIHRLATPGLGLLTPWTGAAAVEMDGVRGPRLDAFVEGRLTATASERVGYPTQKPLALLRLLIETGSRPGDLVVDPCCGSGTTLVAAAEMYRRAIGFDRSADAVATAQRRLGLPEARVLA